MPIHLNPDDDARRESRLSTVGDEKTNAINSKAGAEAARDQEFQKDQLNITYQTYWGNIVQAYENEKTSVDGTSMTLSPSTPWNSGVTNGIVEQIGEMFGPLYKKNQTQPLRLPEFYPAHPIGEYAPYTINGAAGSYESMTDPWRANSLEFLQNGFSDGAFSTTLTVPLSPGNTFPQLSSSAGLSVGNRLVFHDNNTGHSAIGIVTSTFPVQINYTAGLAGTSFASAFTLSDNVGGTVVTRTLPAFTNGERTAMTSVQFQEVLVNARLNWIAYINAVKPYLVAQKSIFDANQHDGKDLAYGTSLANRIAQINAYLVSSLVDDTSLLNFQNNTLIPRVSERNARIAALPGIFGTIYDKRYAFVNLRGNTVLGSYALFKTYTKGVTAAQTNIDFATQAAGAYET